jgi:hypothetical protein
MTKGVNILRIKHDNVCHNFNTLTKNVKAALIDVTLLTEAFITDILNVDEIQA